MCEKQMSTHSISHTYQLCHHYTENRELNLFNHDKMSLIDKIFIRTKENNK
jgi:hypothetical protein